jgi:hypothetical protein
METIYAGCSHECLDVLLIEEYRTPSGSQRSARFLIQAKRGRIRDACGMISFWIGHI